jgi:hypothetical protein
VRPLILGLIASFALAPAAEATLVFHEGADTSRATVWAANDDGSSARRSQTEIVTAPYSGGRLHVIVPHGWSPDWNR